MLKKIFSFVGSDLFILYFTRTLFILVPILMLLDITGIFEKIRIKCSEHKNNRFFKKRGLIKPSLEFKTHKRKFNKYLKKYCLKWPFDISPIQFGNGYVGDKSMLATYCFFYRAFIDRETCRALDSDSLPARLFFAYMDLKYGDAVERENKNVYESEFKFPFGTVKIVSGKLTEEEKTERKVFEKYLEIQRDRFAHRRRMGEFYREAIKFSDSEDKPDEI